MKKIFLPLFLFFCLNSFSQFQEEIIKQRSLEFLNKNLKNLFDQSHEDVSIKNYCIDTTLVIDSLEFERGSIIELKRQSLKEFKEYSFKYKNEKKQIWKEYASKSEKKFNEYFEREKELTKLIVSNKENKEISNVLLTVFFKYKRYNKIYNNCFVILLMTKNDISIWNRHIL